MENGIQAVELLTNKVILFVVSMVVAYAVITMLVYKTKIFQSVNKFAKEIIHKLMIICMFGGLGYYFTVLS